MQKARGLAAERGLDPSIAEAAYRGMMAAFLAHEQRVSAEKAATAPK